MSAQSLLFLTSLSLLTTPLFSLPPVSAPPPGGLPPSTIAPPPVADTDTSGGKTSPAFSQANEQAIYWVALIDQGQWASSWLATGGLIKDLISQEQWAAAMQATRARLGSVRSRKVSNFQTTQVLKNGTKGTFMIISYQTNFSKLPGAIETFVLMTEGPLAEWRVISYRAERR